MFEKAIALDHSYGRPHALLAHAMFLDWFRDMTGSDAVLDHAFRLAKKAVALDENEEGPAFVDGRLLPTCLSVAAARAAACGRQEGALSAWVFAQPIIDKYAGMISQVCEAICPWRQCLLHQLRLQLAFNPATDLLLVAP
jgi:hypothetical protein